MNPWALSLHHWPEPIGNPSGGDRFPTGAYANSFSSISDYQQARCSYTKLLIKTTLDKSYWYILNYSITKYASWQARDASNDHNPSCFTIENPSSKESSLLDSLIHTHTNKTICIRFNTCIMNKKTKTITQDPPKYYWESLIILRIVHEDKRVPTWGKKKRTWQQINSKRTTNMKKHKSFWKKPNNIW